MIATAAAIEAVTRHPSFEEVLTRLVQINTQDGGGAPRPDGDSAPPWAMPFERRGDRSIEVRTFGEDDQPMADRLRRRDRSRNVVG